MVIFRQVARLCLITHLFRNVEGRRVVRIRIRSRVVRIRVERARIRTIVRVTASSTHTQPTAETAALFGYFLPENFPPDGGVVAVAPPCQRSTVSAQCFKELIIIFHTRPLMI